MKNRMIDIGNFFFRYRNFIFPLIILAFYLVAAPPAKLFLSETLEEVKDCAALLIALSGLLFRAVVIGYIYIKRGGRNKRVYAKDLVTSGMFSVCRNPLYVGNLTIYLGIFLMHGNLVIIVLGMLTYLFIYQCIVLAEEAYLEEKFGDGYRAYCRDVPRWIPSFSRFRQATQGMVFSIRRVLLKDYTTITATFLILALTEGYEEIAVGNIEVLRQPLMLFSIGIPILFVAIVKILKDRRWLMKADG